MTTRKRALQSSEALARQLQKATPEADFLSLSSPCRPLVLFLRGSLVGRQKLATVSGRAGKPCPDVLLFSSGQSFWSSPPHVLLLASCCPSSGFHWQRLPAYLWSYRRPVFLLSSLPFSPLVLLLACSPHVVLLVLSGDSLSFFCPLGVFVLFSFPHPFVLCCPPHVLLWSFCCPAAVVLFTLLSEAGAEAAAAHHHNNNSCRQSCLGSVLARFGD